LYSAGSIVDDAARPGFEFVGDVKSLFIEELEPVENAENDYDGPPEEPVPRP
jgi:hypothetical protein